MRALLLLLLPTLVLQAAPFPPPLTPERAVSAPTLDLAVGDQDGAAVASNGEVALAVWHDRRAGSGAQVFAARITPAGDVLDPAGIALTAPGWAAFGGVVWNGTHFAVALQHGHGSAWSLVFVAPDGAIAGSRALDIASSVQWEDATDGGPGVRMLFVSPRADRQAEASIVDGDGDVIVRDMKLVSGAERSRTIVGGSRGSELLVLVSGHRAPELQRERTFAVRIGADGRILSTSQADYSLPATTSAALEGGPAGWLLVTEEPARFRLFVRTLDERGATASAPAVLFDLLENVQSRMRPRIVRENGRFTVVWSAREPGQPSSTWAALVADDGVATEPRRLQLWSGFAGHVAVAIAAGQRLVLTPVWDPTATSGSDLFAQTVSDALTAAPPVVLANSSTLQSNVSVAAGRNGYLTAWVERSPAALHFMVWRVSHDGSMQGLPLEAAHTTEDDPAEMMVVSNGNHYLVAWLQNGLLLGRRMGAESGLWIDDGPFMMADGSSFALGSNGTDALAMWRGACVAVPGSGGPTGACLYARRFRFTGNPHADPEVILLSGDIEPNQIALGSNGSDYLAAWVEGDECIEWCDGPDRLEVLALRLRADGTKIDAAPLVLVGKDAAAQPWSPSVAWNAGRYLVAWGMLEPAPAIEGALVTAEGTVLERRVPIRDALPDGSATPYVHAHRDQFVLFALETRVSPVTLGRTATWTAVSFDAGAPLETVRALPRTVIVHDGMTTLGAASSGAAMLVAYDRLGEPETGRVSRAYTRLFGGYGPRRRAVR